MLDNIKWESTRKIINGKQKVVRRKRYKNFPLDEIAILTMRDAISIEQYKIENDNDIVQRTFVQIELPKYYFKQLQLYGFEIQNIKWDSRDEVYNDIVADSYDFIVSSPDFLELNNCCKNVLYNSGFERLLYNYLQNSSPNKVIQEVAPYATKVNVWLSLPSILAYRLKFLSLTTGVYMSDIVTHLLGFFVPMKIVRNYGNYIQNQRYIVMDEGMPCSIDYRVINKMWTEILFFANDKVRNSLDISSFKIADDNSEFEEDFGVFLEELITNDSPYYQVKFT